MFCECKRTQIAEFLVNYGFMEENMLWMLSCQIMLKGFSGIFELNVWELEDFHMYMLYIYVCVNLLYLPHFPWINRSLHIQVIGSEKLPMTRSVRRSVGPLVCHISLKCIKFKFQCSYRSTWFCLDKSSALVFALFKFLLQSTVPRFYQLFHSINYCNICIFFLLFKLCQSINCYISLLYYAN